MPPSMASRVGTWEKRVRGANKIYDNWAEQFETKRLEEYYLSRQWKGLPEDQAKKLYVINLVYASVEVNKPSLVFSTPVATVHPRPARENALGSDVSARARLCQDTIQTFIDDPDFGFEEETSLALHEAHFRFAVVEVGYTANWIDNPDAGKPVLKEDSDEPVLDSDGNTVPQPARKVTSEKMYIKRIPASQFRVSISQRNRMSRNDWVGYYEWHYVEDVKANDSYSNTDGLKATGTIVKDARGDDTVNKDDIDRHHGMVKIWKIWDLRARVKHVIAEGHKKFLVEGESFKFLPFEVLKFHDILESFYPAPPVFFWLGPQDEVNETREMQRAHRRRFYRRYQMLDNTVDTSEIEKFETGGDGTVVTVKREGAISPISDAPLSADVWQHLDRSQLDFMTVSSVGGEQRGVAESDTATQATIIDQRSRLRESAARYKVSRWLGRISRLILMTARENMTLPFWVKRSTDPNADPDAVAAAVDTWKEITSDELDNIDLDVTVDISSLSPVSQEIQRMAWNQVLMLIANPALALILSQSPVLLRKTLTLYGVTAETEIREIQKVLAAVVQQLQMAAASQGAAPPGPGAPDAASAAGGRTVNPNDISAVLGAVTQGAPS